MTVMSMTIGDRYPFLNPIRSMDIDFDLLGVRAGNCFRNAGIFKWGDLTEKTQAELFLIPNFGQTSYDEITRLIEGDEIALLSSQYASSSVLKLQQGTISELESELEELNRRLNVGCFPSQVAGWASTVLKVERIGDLFSPLMDTDQMARGPREDLRKFLDVRLNELNEYSALDITSLTAGLMLEFKSELDELLGELDTVTFSDFRVRLQKLEERFEDFFLGLKSELDELKSVLEKSEFPNQIAEWTILVLGAEKVGDVLTPIVNMEIAPTEIQSQLEDFLDVRLEELRAYSSEELDVGRIKEFFNQMDERDLIIFENRVIDKRATLEEVGEMLGVTRERIRQKAIEIESRYRTVLDQDAFNALQWFASAIRRQVHPFNFFAEGVSELRSLVERNLPTDLRKMAEHEVDNAVALVIWASDLTRLTEENWLVLDEHLFEITNTAFDEVTADMKLVKLRDLALVFRDLGHAKPLDLAGEFLLSKGWRKVSESQYALWAGSAVDKAVIVLEMQGKPLTAYEINEIIDEGHSPESLQNQFPHDERFVRTDQFQRYGLAEWDLEEYSGIYQEICERIERGGGEASVKAILEEFTRLFGVAENSVKVNLKNGSFQVSGDVVRFSENFEFDPVDPSLIDDAVETPEGWGQKIVINDEYLNGGYSFQISADIAYSNGVRPGDKLMLPVNVDPEWNGQVSVIWRKQTVYRRIDVGRHRELLQRDFSIGDEIIVVPGREQVSIFRST